MLTIIIQSLLLQYIHSIASSRIFSRSRIIQSASASNHSLRWSAWRLRSFQKSTDKDFSLFIYLQRLENTRFHLLIYTKGYPLSNYLAWLLQEQNSDYTFLLIISLQRTDILICLMLRYLKKSLNSSTIK